MEHRFAHFPTKQLKLKRLDVLSFKPEKETFREMIQLVNVAFMSPVPQGNKIKSHL